MKGNESCSLQGVHQTNPALAAKVVIAACEATGLPPYELYKKMDRRMLTEVVVNQVLQQARERKEHLTYEHLSKEVEGLSSLEAGIQSAIEACKTEAKNTGQDLARLKSKLQELSELRDYVPAETFASADRSLKDLIAEAETELNGKHHSKVAQLESQLTNVQNDLREKRAVMEKLAGQPQPQPAAEPATVPTSGKIVEELADDRLLSEIQDAAAVQTPAPGGGGSVVLRRGSSKRPEFAIKR
jgi:transposase